MTHEGPLGSSSTSEKCTPNGYVWVELVYPVLRSPARSIVRWVVGGRCLDGPGHRVVPRAVVLARPQCPHIAFLLACLNAPVR